MNFFSRNIETDGKLLKAIHNNRLLTGQLLSKLIDKNKSIKSFDEVEFKVFSQFGDDGIIQYLLKRIDMPEVFIEFGVENFSEANTRFLLLNNNWKGLVMDGNENHVKSIQEEDIYWKHDLTAVHAFVTAENINTIFAANNFSGEVGILSIDIDGNDYWIWDAVNSVSPVIVIVEYNSVFGDQYPISIPYSEGFYRTNAHYSNLFWGCSISALCFLADKKGYHFIGCNSNGNNAYFIRKDKASDFTVMTPKQGFVNSKVRESRNKEGALTFLTGKERINEIKDCTVVDVTTNKEHTIQELFGL